MINNYKNEKGITLIALMITVIVTILLASVATVTGISTVKRAKYFGAISELKTMQYEVNSMYQKYKNGDESVLEYGEDISESYTENGKSVKTLSDECFEELAISGEAKNKYRYFSYDYIDKTLNVAGISRDFLISIEDRNVILLTGVKFDNQTYYSLSQIDNSLYNVKYLGDGIIPDEQNEEENQEETLNVEAPVVSGKEMIPVVWDEGTLSWVKADVGWNENNWDQFNTELKWYDYSKDKKKWANIVTVEEKGINTREYYEECQAGTEILMQDITSMYVWIPRFEYKNTYYTDNTYQEETNDETVYLLFDIKFIDTNNVSGETGYTVSNCFSYIDLNDNNAIKQLPGFWMAKFEASNYTSKTSKDNIGVKYGSSSEEPLRPARDTTNPLEYYFTIKPGVTSWRNLPLEHDTLNSIKHVINVAKEDEQNIYGLKQNADLELLTSDMWDAVAIINQSEYGNRDNSNNSQMYGNFYYQGDGTSSTCYYTTQTGVVAEYGSNDYTSCGGITKLVENKKEENTGIITINNQYNYYEYWTNIGQKGSTSSNVYGVYDMVGGAKEYTARLWGAKKENESNQEEIVYYTKGGYFASSKEESDLFYNNEAISANDSYESDDISCNFRIAIIVIMEL